MSGCGQYSWDSKSESFDGGNDWGDEFADMLYPVLDGLSSPPVSLDERRTPVRISAYFDFAIPATPAEASALILEFDVAVRGLGYVGRQYACDPENGNYSVTYDNPEFGTISMLVNTGSNFNKLNAFARQTDIVMAADMNFTGFEPRDCLHD